MNFNKHSRLEGLHATLSASKYHWINYDEEKLRTTYANMQAAAMGSRLHAFAAEAISLGRKQKQNHDSPARRISENCPEHCNEIFNSRSSFFNRNDFLRSCL